MNIYSRILSYATPLRKFASLYFLATLCSISFGLANLSSLTPLLQILFNAEELKMLTIKIKNHKPMFSISITYIKELFNYYFVNIIITYGKVAALYFVAGLFVLSFFLKDVFDYLSEIIIAKVRTNVICNLRIELFAQITHLHLGYFTDKNKGDIISRITNDVQEIEHAVGDTLKVFLKDPTKAICFIIVLIHMSMELTMFTLLFLPIAALIIAEIVRRLRKWAHQTQESLGRLMNILEETMWGMRIIKVFGAQSYVMQKFKEENDIYAGTSMSVARKESLAPPISEFLGALAISIILAYGGKLVLLEKSQLTASSFIPYIVMFSYALVPLKAISKSISHIQRGVAAGKRIFVLLDKKTEIKSSKNPIYIKNFERELIFNNVSFSYNNQRDYVLHELNFTIQKGKTVALVGSSGGGKSTIVNLIVRLYDVTSGTIEIDGIALQDLAMQSLHGMIGTVTQDSILFHDTVFNNILFNRFDVREEEVIKAAQVANAHEFIVALPQGYQTIIGEQGNKLSSGQKQRLCIARAVLQNPSILILDEATSALDSASERRVQEAIDQVIRGKTAIVIAHRLSTIQHADEIIVIEHGKIMERGTHQMLMQQNGIYKKLNLIQQT